MFINLSAIMIKTCHFLNSKAAGLGPLETVRVSVNFFGWFVLHRPLGIVRNAFQSGQYSNGRQRCTQLLLDSSLFFINSNFVEQLSGRK
ncbi:hypothetical protein DA077_03655 [Lactiplantibacillus paraplantarum]|uniref:Uncharacterized protein n=1 Tax=Lactiplantibacillus paraplantarum TaxID=60520 RepID=A0AAD0TMT3_9LACO|nr:hypothetical protein DA077_03655 [Lactiplantibacillus paraplantarum]AYJ37909.1 hypothetical protein LP667_03260 [Lactiplantibacillus paraplantarum]